MADVERIHHILDYWHKIEFFIPFDLKQVFDHADDDSLKWIEPADLAPGAASLWAVGAIPEERELTGFRLYLGVFDMQAIVDFANTLSPEGACIAPEEEERTALDGRSCMARITLDAAGEPAFDPLSVSTAPWAIGTARSDGLEMLGSASFDRARRSLSDQLFNFETERRRRRRAGLKPDEPSIPLTGDEILQLRDLLAAWSNWESQTGSTVALLEIVTREKKPRTKPSNGGAEVARDDAGALDRAAPADDDEAGDEAQDDAPTVDILNSFYIEDIERCMASVDAGDVPAALRAYLTPGDPARRVDLYTDAGRAAIIDTLRPEKTNAGRWPADASQKMSLMQQFAINTAFDHLKEDGVFSVNGPPGTGKTTLLRDMICENVVRRASRLAKLARAADALADVSTGIRFMDGDVARIRTLRADLTGFEMVVASSNNAAVENISNDLPKQKQLGAEWSGVRYLQPIAHKIAAQVGDRKMTRLDADDVPWGLVSCALGNGDNRWRFKERFFIDSRPLGERGGPSDPQAFWAWRDRYSGPTFQSARASFLEAESAYQAALSDRVAFRALHSAWGHVTEAQFAQPAADALRQAEQHGRDASAELAACDGRTAAADAALAELQEEERLLDRARPGFFSRFFRTEGARRHMEQVATNARAQIDARRTAVQCRLDAASARNALDNAQSQAKRASAELINARRVWAEKHALLADGCRRFGKASLPVGSDQLESDEVQRNGFGHDDEFARLRSGLFVAGLALHEAWLAEVSRKGGGFGGNLVAIQKLLAGTRLEDPAEAEFIWQSLFMVVPVVSSTFASFARQFRGMGPRSIGWLFIDEAGQAVPQAAVGALWRARRAVVVGDPLQIEPVFTVPTRLINALADLSPHTSDGRCSPARVSVQRLADEANPFGTYVPVEGDDPLWIGSPLRVHRRCCDKMFTIANRIAYRDKMVYGLKSRAPSGDPLERLGASAWIDVRGRTSDRQVVPAQIEVIAALVIRLYADSGALPPLYVIAPFKAIRKALSDRLQAIQWVADTGRRGPSSKVWRQWCSQRIGTVHTFQGKEESVVVFVLGADHESAASANWAASKPNLLNVAVTRARHRLFVVGDASLWGGLKYFSEARFQLGEASSADAWLARLDEAPHGHPA
ncbi:DEAD/DEAH box helicase [Burkholderia sp. AU38729]|uniref:DEAD/DEAH box helicase n=1 Tax=Burkholderia sp. AU38729 TaxID=2879633 RepID=UPI001CF2A005|nr:DEAD/DEAH box helicase [Burkholderia sp. AU38729]MCA8065196.1 ATP-binding protein [Burkholderia sp. AU38729]